MPAFGKPTSAASASSFRWSSSVASSPGKPGLRESRCATSRRGEALVAAPGDAAARGDDARIRRGQVCDQLRVLVEHLRADRNADLDGLARGAVLQRAAAGLAVARLEPPLRAERREVAQVRVRDEDDVSARAAVAAVGTTLRDVLLTPKVQAAVAAATRLHVDAGAVVEHEPSRRRR